MKALLIAFSLLLFACSDRTMDASHHAPVLELKLVQSSDTNQKISHAFVVVYDSLMQAVASGFSDDKGMLRLELAPSSYRVQVDAQSYFRFPRLGGNSPIYTLKMDSVHHVQIALDVDSNSMDKGALLGKVLNAQGVPVVGARVIASGAQGFGECLSDAQGQFALFNLGADSYRISAQKAHFWSEQTLSVQVQSRQSQQGLVLRMSEVQGTKIFGTISFLASSNAKVDLTLVDPVTMLPIPGLVAWNDSGSRFQLLGVAPGEYIAWASYQNDGYVVDPDWIRKFGMPKITVKPGDTALELNLSVTGADTLAMPTNAATSLVAQEVDSDSLIFKWAKYPSAKEYFIEVRDSQGRLIWGGIDSVQSNLLKILDARTISCSYNYDGSAREALKKGETYHWKIWADRDATPGIQGLLTSSEDQMGYFRIKP